MMNTQEEEIGPDLSAAFAALVWQWECGIDEAVNDTPSNQFELVSREGSGPLHKRQRLVSAKNIQSELKNDTFEIEQDPVVQAEKVVKGADTLTALRNAITDFDLCPLKKGARNTVFSDGNPVARVLVLGEAPGRDEDIEGLPFVGRAGQLLDRMFGAIGLSRKGAEPENALYITNVMPWRPPGNREPEPSEIAMMQPFVQRHIELVNPEIVVVMGNTPLFALAGKRGILKARGVWHMVAGRTVLPMAHPAYLLRNPIAKREAWADLQALRRKLISKAD